MVNTGDEKGSASFNTTPTGNEAAKNDSGSEGTSLPLAEPDANDQFEDNVEIPSQEADDKGPEEFLDPEESEKVAKVRNNDENILATEMNNENEAKSHQNITEHNETDDQGGLMWDDEQKMSEGDSEDHVGDKDGASYEDSGNEKDDEDEVSADETSEEDYNKDEVGRDDATKVSKGDEMEAKAKEDTSKAKENGNKRKPVAKEENKETVVKEGESKPIVKEDVKGAKAKQDTKEAKDNRSDKQAAYLGNDKDSNGRSKRKKVRVGMSKKMGTKDKSESSQKRKGKKRVESMGMIFMCSSKTKDDCYLYKVLGLPESKKEIVEKIYTGMRLFLYDVDLKLLYGIYKAAGPGGYNIEPKAFKSQFPAQVRFTVLDDCLPLPEEKFKKVIQENYFTKTKFDCQLKADQVKKLCKLFAISSKGCLPKKAGGSRRVEKKLHPLHQESKKRVRSGKDEQPPAIRHSDRRPHKRPRTAVVSSPLRRQPPPRAPLVAYASPHRTTSDVNTYRRDPYSYRDVQESRQPVIVRSDTYVDGHDLYVERRDSYYRNKDRLYQYPTVERRDAYMDGRAYLELRAPDVGIRGRDLYLERRDPPRDAVYAELSYGGGVYGRRDRLLSDSRDGYGEGLYLERGGAHRSLSFGSRYRPDSFVPTRQLPLADDPIYSREYPYRAGMDREYHL
ncbi:DCD (Development and Cell Death) domain protein [Striga hermonthica]|uniref:DCD (Development and Cell Death) domain protein n=1 Tax=Striga hermonthica TaxID=68872 RepID=A0A9N7MJ61_STRHE|nr:DCD (Development and Cell Death) domain protein [Striga hermonthica]